MLIDAWVDVATGLLVAVLTVVVAVLLVVVSVLRVVVAALVV